MRNQGDCAVFYLKFYGLLDLLIWSVDAEGSLPRSGIVEGGKSKSDDDEVATLQMIEQTIVDVAGEDIIVREGPEDAESAVHPILHCGVFWHPDF